MLKRSFPLILGADDRPVEITVAEEKCTKELMSRLRGLLGNYPGNTPVRIRVRGRSATTVVQVSNAFNVQSGAALAADLSVLLEQYVVSRLPPHRPGAVAAPAASVSIPGRSNVTGLKRKAIVAIICRVHVDPPEFGHPCPWNVSMRR